VGGSFDEVSVRVADFTVAPNGAFVVLEPGENPYSAASWIELKTPVFALAESDRVTVEFALNVPSDPGEGSYSAAIVFEPKTKAELTEVRGKALVFKSRISVPVLVRIAGTVRPGYRLVESRVKDGEVQLVIENTGNTYLSLTGAAKFYGKDGEVLYTKDAPHVFLDREATAVARVPIPKDERIVLVTVEYWAKGFEDVLPVLYAEEVVEE